MGLSKTAYHTERIISPVTSVVNSVGAGVLAVMMFLTVADVILRYFFNRPLVFAYELTELMNLIVVFLALAYTGILKGHVSVDVAISRFQPRARAVIGGITYLASLGIIVLIACRTVVQAQITWLSGGTTPILDIPLFLFYLVAALGCALYSVVLLKDLFSSVAEAVSFRWKRWEWLLVLGVVVLLASTAPLWLHYLLALTIEPLTLGAIGIIVLILVLFSGMPVAWVMGGVGLLGIWYLCGTNSVFNVLGTVPYRSGASYGLSIIPMFMLMGEFAFISGLSRRLYRSVYVWIGYLRGGLAMATIGGCAAFAAISGSSTATSAAMSSAALPEMRRYKYDSALATGCIAAGGTIGVLIPPSVILIIYAVLTEQSVGKLFMAGIFPGLLEVLFYLITIYIICRRNPKLGPPGPRTPFREKVAALKGTMPVLVLFVVVMGGIYTGVFSPTEAAGIGAFGTFVYMLGTRQHTWKNFTSSLTRSVRPTAMIFAILIGAMIFGYFLSVSRVPFELADLVSELSMPPVVILIFIMGGYLFLGAFMSTLAVIIITVPIIFPVILALGYDPIWFGIIIVVVCEIGSITPPFGITVYTIAGMAPDIPMFTIFRGIVPFFLADLCRMALLIAVPQIALFLPNLMW